MCVPSCSPISHWITAADAWIKSPVRNVFPSLRGTMHVHSLTLEGWFHIHLPKPIIFSNLILRRGPESVICDIAMCLEPVLVQSSACSVEIETWCLQCTNTEDGCGWTCRIKMLTWYLLGFLIILFHTRVQGIFNTATEKGPEWGPICQNIKKAVFLRCLFRWPTVNFAHPHPRMQCFHSSNSASLVNGLQTLML